MNKIISQILYELRYPGFSNDFKSIQRNHYVPWEELKLQQDILLRQVIKHAFETVPFYIEYSKENKISFLDIKSQSDLIKLPIIQKKDFVKNINSFYSMKNEKFINSSTGGSTGEPLRYRMSKECARYNQLIKLRAWGISGYRPGDMLCIFAGGSLYQKKNIRNDIINKLTNTIAFSSYGVSEEKLYEIYDAINDRRPNYFYGYASAWVILSEFMMANHLGFHYKPTALFSTSEVLLPNQRKLIQEAMNVEVYDEYGLNDSGASAHECEEHRGQHVDFERAILQIVDDGGNIIENGTGRVIATGLRNYAMPFIRYDTGDIASITAEPCSCGRTTPRLLKIDGRTTDYLYIHGVYIGSPVLTVLMGKIEVNTYRIIQEDENTVKVNLVVSAETFYDEKKKENIIRTIKDSFEAKVPSANIEVYFYQTLAELGVTNKHKLIINKRKANQDDFGVVFK